MEKVEKILKEDFDVLYSGSITKNHYDEIIDAITNRVNYIVHKIAKQTDRNRFWWDFDNCQYDSEKSGGEFDPKQYKENIGIGGEYFNFPEIYDEGFPTRWLWEDFEEEFAAEVQKAKGEKLSLKEKERQKRKIRKQRNEALQASAKAKLTPEEWKAVRLK